MIYKIVSATVIVLLVVALLMMALTSKKRQEEIDQLLQEMVVSTKYIQTLNDQLTKASNNTKPIVSEDERLLKVLNNYLKENKRNGDVTVEELSKYEKEDRFIPNLIPINGEYAISQQFKNEHPALDFAAEEGTEVLASAAGEILSVYEDEYFGKVILIDHLNEYATMYAHLATAIYESKTFVKKGEPIGLVGSTGNSSAPHLHFEVLKNGENIDPETILKD
jgi:murein DD-endopeptidase MepM/ murein hydrolase activator NlpD